MKNVSECWSYKCEITLKRRQCWAGNAVCRPQRGFCWMSVECQTFAAYRFNEIALCYREFCTGVPANQQATCLKSDPPKGTMKFYWISAYRQTPLSYLKTFTKPLTWTSNQPFLPKQYRVPRWQCWTWVTLANIVKNITMSNKCCRRSLSFLIADSSVWSNFNPRLNLVTLRVLSLLQTIIILPIVWSVWALDSMTT